MKRGEQSKPRPSCEPERPGGWPPPLPEGVPCLALSWEDAARDLYVAGILSRLAAAARSAYYCRLFYIDRVSPSVVLGPTWSPWRDAGTDLMAMQSVLPQVEDESPRTLCQAWVEQVQALQQVNAEWKEALAGFFGVPAPSTEEGEDGLRARVDAHRAEKGPTWLRRPGFRALVRRLEEIIAVLQQLQPQLQDAFAECASGGGAYGDVPAARAEPAGQDASGRLYGQTGAQAIDIYLELGLRYAELEDMEQAIASYTQSAEATKEPYAMAHFRRGELYYQQEQWAQARRDFERALALGLDSPQRELAVQYVAELQSR